jgi:UDP-N-acetylmuramyl pentapeptide phosphotransferase/UDP-N-acetylglucosamine-1-phosphate transferase
MNLFLVFVVLNFILLNFYFYLADKYQIIDKPNERSSHSVITIRGGGIVFVFGSILFSAFNWFAYPFLLTAIVITGIVSFWDDVKGISRRIRFLSHLLAIVLVLKESNLLFLNWWIIPLVILLIGIVNAYNFMDGINGITGYYSLAIFIPFWIREENILLKEFMLVSIVSLVVFLYFNSRKKAKCFAGDIGSITMALMVLFVVLTKIEQTGRVELISVLFVYGIDSIFTIFQRLLDGENIFDPHRKHLYQYLVNEFKINHLVVSGAYALIQISFNFWLIFTEPNVFIVALTLFGFGLSYLAFKFYLIKKLARNKI